MAPGPEDVLVGGGRLLHVGANSHLHVPVQKCVRALQTDHGHVGGRVRFFERLLPWGGKKKERK